MIKRKPVIGVMGSGTEAYDDLCGMVARLIYAKNCHLLTGGGMGCMESVSKAFVECKCASNEGGICIGVVPVGKEGYPNKYVELVIRSPLGVYAGDDPTQISRNHINVMTSDIIIALPGSKGTKNEIDIASRMDKPLILFGPSERFKDFPINLDRAENIQQVETFVDKHLNLGQ